MVHAWIVHLENRLDSYAVIFSTNATTSKIVLRGKEQSAHSVVLEPGFCGTCESLMIPRLGSGELGIEVTGRPVRVAIGPHGLKGDKDWLQIYEGKTGKPLHHCWEQLGECSWFDNPHVGLKLIFRQASTGTSKTTNCDADLFEFVKVDGDFITQSTIPTLSTEDSINHEATPRNRGVDILGGVLGFWKADGNDGKPTLLPSHSPLVELAKKLNEVEVLPFALSLSEDEQDLIIMARAECWQLGSSEVSSLAEQMQEALDSKKDRIRFMAVIDLCKLSYVSLDAILAIVDWARQEKSQVAALAIILSDTVWSSAILVLVEIVLMMFPTQFPLCVVPRFEAVVEFLAEVSELEAISQ